MSYNNISQKTKDGFNGAKDVTLSRAIPGLTRFSDEPFPTPKVERKDETVPEDELFKTLHPTISSTSASLTSVANHTKYPRRSKSVNLESCKTDASPTYFDKELDVNSAASALRKAIEKAQESVRIAKESVGRRRRGLQSFSNKKFKDNFEVEGNMEDVTAAPSSQLFPDFMDGKKLFIAKKVMDAINEKISESNKECVVGVMGETESRPHDSAGKDEYATLSSDVVDTETTKTGALDFVHGDQTRNMFVDDYGGKIEVVKTTIDAFKQQEVEEDQVPVVRVGLDVLRLSKENIDEVRLCNTLESIKEANNLNVSEKMEAEKGLEVSKRSNQNDKEKILNALENEKQKEFFEENNVENAENAKTDKGIEEGFEWPGNENESIDDHNTEIHKEEGSSEIFYDDCELKIEVNLPVDSEIKQEDYNITVESKGESLDECYDQEFNVKSAGEDKVLEESDSIDGIYVAGNIVDMNEKLVETTQRIADVTEASSNFQLEDTVSEKEFCEKTSMDQIASDNNEGICEATSEDIDELYETSSITTRYVKIEVYESHKQKNIINSLTDLSSENDVQAESYSCITHGANIEEEESNIQSPDKEKPNTGKTNEIKVSQEPHYNDKEDEIEKPGPSKVSVQDHFRRIYEAAAAKEKEREKSKIAVERAISEARDRALAEARERAKRQRAAVEIAIEEARQRMMAEACEKVTKASVANKSSSVQPKLRAERAVVERTTSEAHQHALDRAMSQKTVSDLNSSEPALRTKKKLEKHNRITERAAKALAEKQKRDRLAQKEQAERNCLAENLDADIKRWSNGKEGNLRSLLSTLQYILGPESGWQPVSLAHMTTTNDVKKAYRKATLCVHPDKLQQWGASIQHKYICEKVFNLLKVAWKTFNSEEGSRDQVRVH